MAFRFAFLVLAVYCAACQMVGPLTTQPFAPTNQADYEFRASHVSADRTVGLVSVYRQSLGSVLYSACKNAPSDSQYLKMASFGSCSEAEALIASVGRLLREHDLGVIAPKRAILLDGRLRWIDFPSVCR